MEQTETPDIQTKNNHEETGKRIPRDTVCCILFSALAVFGLFAGAFLSSPLGLILAGRETLLSDSLFGILVEVMRGSITKPQTSPGFGEIPLFLYFMTFVTIVTTVISLSLSILSLTASGLAHICRQINGRMIWLVYTLIAFGVFLSAATDGDLSHAYDAPSLLVSGAAVVIFFCESCLGHGKKAIRNLLFYLFSMLALFSFFYPGTPLMQQLDALLTHTSEQEMSITLSLRVLLLILPVNGILSACLIGNTKRRLFDVIRFGLQTGAVLALTLTSYIGDAAFTVITDQLLPYLILASSSLAALFSALFFTSKNN